MLLKARTTRSCREQKSTGNDVRGTGHTTTGHRWGHCSQRMPTQPVGQQTYLVRDQLYRSVGQKVTEHAHGQVEMQLRRAWGDPVGEQ